MRRLALMVATAAAGLCVGDIALARLRADAIRAPAPAAIIVAGRQALPVSAETRALILAQMRDILTVVEAVDDAASGRDWAAVAAAARRAGGGAFQAAPDPAMREWPQDFRGMGRKTRLAFDAIAEVAASSNPFAVNAKLTDAMQYCAACHQTHRLTRKP